jgi:hypothetical protein
MVAAALEEVFGAFQFLSIFSLHLTSVRVFKVEDTSEADSYSEEIEDTLLMTPNIGSSSFHP